ncbi:hypothetical protein [Sphaerisporangium dianthi]|uniref:Uncharacterized protein n=1 Tax=Sphaerisporangium dianthi TaxID=1436120 RepID=A0ABV9CTV6_9ACTN
MGDKETLDLSAPQIVGGALAAATAAVGASFLGVHGTVIGAALASAGTTVGNAIYTHYIHRTKDRLKEAHELIVGQRERDEIAEQTQETVIARAGEEGLATAVHATVREHGPADLPTGAGDPVPLTGRAEDLPPLRREAGRRPLWVTMIVAAVATFALSMGGILAFELVSGRPLSATVHGTQGSGTSFGGTVSDQREPSPAPSATGGSGTGPANGPSAKPTTDESGQTGQRSEEPSIEPSAAASPESTGGTGEAPTADPDTADPDTGGQGRQGGSDGGAGSGSGNGAGGGTGGPVSRTARG